MSIISGITLLVIITAAYILFRNEAVFKERGRILDICSSLAEQDIKEGKEWRNRYSFLTEVSYDSMLYKFWLPVKSFYEDYKES